MNGKPENQDTARRDADKAGEKKRREADTAPTPSQPRTKPKETGGPKGPEPTRYGDWERKGRCIDF